MDGDSGCDMGSDINGDMGCNMGVDRRVIAGKVMDSKVSDKIGRVGIIDGGDYPMRACPFDVARRYA